jgi:hypothetical protein
MALIREVIEELAPVGAMRSREAVVAAHGPEPQQARRSWSRGVQAIAGKGQRGRLSAPNRGRYIA